jgi:hypothetical protein
MFTSVVFANKDESKNSAPSVCVLPHPTNPRFPEEALLEEGPA